MKQKTVSDVRNKDSDDDDDNNIKNKEENDGFSKCTLFL
jgi:hypothetical protein